MEKKLKLFFRKMNESLSKANALTLKLKEKISITLTFIQLRYHFSVYTHSDIDLKNRDNAVVISCTEFVLYHKKQT